MSLMENTKMTDPMVIVIQPTTADVVTNGRLVKKYTEQASSHPSSEAKFALECDAKFETTDKDGQNLRTPQGNTTEVTVLDASPERQRSIKDENIGNIIESLNVKPDVQDGDGSSFCQNKEVSDGDIINRKHGTEGNSELNTSLPQVVSNVAVQYLKLEKVDKDEQGLRIPLGLSTEVAIHVKHDNIGNVTESLDIKRDVQPDFIPKCPMEYDNPAYLYNSKLIFKPERSGDDTQELAALEETEQKSEVIGTAETCKGLQPVSVTERINAGQALEESSAVYICHNNKKEVLRQTEQFNENRTRQLRTYTGGKRFSCPYCDKRFTQDSSLSTHIRIHNDDQPLSCPHCEKRFTHKSTLSLHARTHTGEKPFSCLHCEKRFNRKSSLASHIGLHTGEKPFSCCHCEKRFSDKSTAKRHSMIHTGDMPFSCPYCDKQFNRKSSLTRHIGTHNGNKALLHSD